MYEVGLWYIITVHVCARRSERPIRVEAQTAEETKSVSKTESCDRKPVIDLNLIYFVH